MNKVTLSRLIYGTMLLMLAACSQDELTEQSEKLPEGAYPVEIGSVSVAGISSEVQTRMTESADGNSSVWSNGDVIGVQISDTLSNGSTVTSEGQYTVSVGSDNSVSAITAVSGNSAYWQTTGTSTVTAWYPADTTVSLADQSNGMAYVLKGSGTGSYGSSVSLNFTHQLSKIRVVPTGENASSVVTSAWLYSFTHCTNKQGTVTGQTGSEGWLDMKQESDNDLYYEANVVPGYTISKIKITNDREVTITPSITPQAGMMHTVTITVYSATDLSSQTGDITITDSKTYHFKTTSTTSNRIIVNGTGITPTIYLHDVAISTSSGSAIDIKSGSPTIMVDGASNSVTSSSGAGIFVASGNTVTITGSSRDDILTVTGNEGSSGIGGYVAEKDQCANCGNVNISNVTVYAYSKGSSSAGTYSPGIGGAGNATCGTITISNAAVHAYGTTDLARHYVTPGIGSGYHFSKSTTSIPTVIIDNSDIYAHRGASGNFDYIGWADDNIMGGTNSNSAINLGSGGSCKNSTVYCYTGTSETTADKTVTYDANGTLPLRISL